MYKVEKAQKYRKNKIITCKMYKLMKKVKQVEWKTFLVLKKEKKVLIHMQKVFWFSQSVSDDRDYHQQIE